MPEVPGRRIFVAGRFPGTPLDTLGLGPAVLDAPLVAPAEVTLDTLQAAIELAKLEFHREGDDPLRVYLGDDAVSILIHPTQPWVQFVMMVLIDPSAPEALKFETANELNRTWELVRFHIAESDSLVADYVLPFEQGITPMQIVLTMQVFVATVLDALRQSEHIRHIV